MLAVPLYGQQDKDVFGDEVFSALGKAIDLNEARNYIEAYRQIALAEKELDSTLQKKGLAASALGDDEFRYPFWEVKKSKAEIAYMLGIHTDMERAARELHQAFDVKRQHNEWEKSVLDDLQAKLAKIDGDCYYLKEQFDSAEVALKMALAMSADFLVYDFDFFHALRGDLAQLYYRKGDYKEALAQLDTVLTHQYFHADVRGKDSESIEVRRKEVESQRALCLARLGRFSEALKAIGPVVRYFKKGNDKRLYAESLRKKAKMLMLQYDETGKYSPEALTCYRDYLAVSRDYIDSHFVQMSESEREQYWMAEQPFVTDCFRLEDKDPGLLYDVALYSKAVLLQMGRDFKEGMTQAERKQALASIRVTWQQVRDKLPAQGCAIEFIVYEKKGEKHIGALVIDKKSVRPKFIDMGRYNSISSFRVAPAYSVKDVFANTRNQGMINALYNDSTLRELIWNEEIVNAIGNCSDIFFSPDGLYHQMGIEYMAPPSIAGKQFHRLTTTRQLVYKRQAVNTDKMLLCGGVDYGLTVDDNEKGNDQLAYSVLASMKFNLDPLPNSAMEIDSVKAVRRNHKEDVVLRADSVTEAALNQLSGKYHIVHISTHGMFSEVAKVGTDIHPSSADMQLSKSCLFLSGAERNLKENGFDASQHDGVLSARELAKMDLGEVDLTVMSACMSGLGYITPDGIYGLQRGLKTAGVKAIISTLWSVNDKASCLFIIQLYKNLEEGQGLHEAFSSARATLMDYEQSYGNDNPETEPASGSYVFRNKIFDNPYYYNAFILIDGLE